VRRRSTGLVLALVGATAAGAQTLETTGSFSPEAEIRFTAISPDGRQLAAACADRNLRLYSLPMGQITKKLELGDARVSALAYARNGKRLAAGTTAGSVRVYDLVGSIGSVFDTMAAPLAITAIALSPDGTRLAIAPLDLPVQLWEIASHKRTADLTANFAGANAVAFSPDGTVVATANADTTVRIYDAATGKEVARYEELLVEPLGLDFGPDSKTLVVGGVDGMFVALDPATGRVVRRSSPYPDPIRRLAVLPDGKAVVALTFTADNMEAPGNVIAWSLAGGDVQGLASGLRFNGRGLADGRLLLTSNDGKQLKLWSVR
jgi:WD40 repeat protein